MNLKEINTRLEELNTQLNDNQGRHTEVYSRIVGYYRSVKNWNKGKKEEFGIRKTYQIHCTPAPLGNEGMVEEPQVEEVKVQEEVQAPVEALESQESAPQEAASDQDYQKDLFAEASEEVKTGDYRFYFRKDCPNCPPMKDFLSTLDLNGQHVNVDMEEGLQMAVEDNVYQAPTVIMLNEKGEETFRTDNPAGLEEFLSRKEEVVTA